MAVLSNQPRRQEGYILVVSMVLLLVLTLLALAGINAATRQTQASAVQRQISQAHDAADMAITRVEAQLAAAPFEAYQPPGCYLGGCGNDGQDGLRIIRSGDLFATDAASVVFLDESRWDDPRVIDMHPIAEAPPAQVVIEQMNFYRPDSLNPADNSQGGVVRYRISARSTGPNGTTPVVLQSVYQKRY